MLRAGDVTAFGVAKLSDLLEEIQRPFWSNALWLQGRRQVGGAEAWVLMPQDVEGIVRVFVRA